MVGAFIFKSQTEHSADIAGMLAGVYSGGTPNMAAIKTAIAADDNIYGALNIADIIMGGIYLIFLTSIGPKVFRYFLPHKIIDDTDITITEDKNPWFQFNFLNKITSFLLPIGLAIFCIILSVGISFLFYQKIDDSLFIILITVFSVFIINKQPKLIATIILILIVYYFYKLISVQKYTD